MKAAVLKSFRKPLSLEEIEDPKPNNDEILLKVRGAGICRGDLHLISGDWYGDIEINLPRILGHEIVGEVVEDKYGIYNEGDLVLVYNSIGCNNCKSCIKSNFQFCKKVKVIGIHLDGGFAEYVKVPRFNLMKVEGNPLELTPLADAGVTAYNAIKNINEGDRVAIIGTTSVSLIAIQLLRFINSEVIVFGSNQAKLNKAKELGADEVYFIDKKENYSESIAKNYSKKFDYIIDFIGSDNTLKDILWLLDREGELRIVGEFGGSLIIPEQLLILRGLKIKGVLYGSPKDLKEIYFIYKSKNLKTLSIPFQLEEINNAINLLINGKIIGRAVIIS
jgi:D-arabinose 1-dehydrogenase-like Zn-dependent alcohol dehydrogenase